MPEVSSIDVMHYGNSAVTIIVRRGYVRTTWTAWRKTRMTVVTLGNKVCQ